MQQLNVRGEEGVQSVAHDGVGLSAADFHDAHGVLGAAGDFLRERADVGGVGVFGDVFHGAGGGWLGFRGQRGAGAGGGTAGEENAFVAAGCAG